MKKIKIILAIFALAILAPSCTDDGGKSKIDFEVGAAPHILKVTGTETSMNLVAIASGVKINLGVTVAIGQGDVVSIDLVGFYKKSTTTEKAYLKKGITTFPTEFKFDQFTIMDAFTSANSPSDFTTLSTLIVSAEMTLKDGRVIKMYKDDGTPLFGQDIANSSLFKVQQTYLSSCTLKDASSFNGNYKVTADGWADYPIGAIVPVTYDAANGLNTFRILSTTNPSIVNKGVPYMIVTINPATATVVSITSNTFYDYGAGGTATVTAGTGTLSSCTGNMNLKVTWGPYGTYDFNLAKQ